MAAAPFVAVLSWETSAGRRFTQRCTVSDVNAAFYTFQDGSSDITLPINEGTVWLKDVMLSAAGTDTTNATIFANQRETGEQIQNGLNLASNLARQYLSSPVPFKAGCRVKFRQNT